MIPRRSGDVGETRVRPFILALYYFGLSFPSIRLSPSLSPTVASNPTHSSAQSLSPCPARRPRPRARPSSRRRRSCCSSTRMTMGTSRLSGESVAASVPSLPRCLAAYLKPSTLASVWASASMESGLIATTLSIARCTQLPHVFEDRARDGDRSSGTVLTPAIATSALRTSSPS